jgi:hypothetical protein
MVDYLLNMMGKSLGAGKLPLKGVCENDSMKLIPSWKFFIFYFCFAIIIVTILS